MPKRARDHSDRKHRKADEDARKLTVSNQERRRLLAEKRGRSLTLMERKVMRATRVSRAREQRGIAYLVIHFKINHKASVSTRCVLE